MVCFRKAQPVYFSFIRQEVGKIHSSRKFLQGIDIRLNVMVVVALNKPGHVTFILSNYIYIFWDS